VPVTVPSTADDGSERVADRYPQRIVCLTPETVDVLYRLGEEGRIAGISGYTVTPALARREKPKVSAFTTADLPKILALEPDLVLGFSDLQAEIARDLARAGIELHLFNQRDVAGILRMVVTVGALVGAGARAEALADELAGGLARARAAAALLPRRPRVYFEEWDAPMIAGIGWVSELIELAGGLDCFADLARRGAASARVIADPAEVVRRAPDIIVGSWCGKRFRAERVAARPGWAAIPAIATGALHEVKSALILQPGPTALTEGLAALAAIVAGWARQRPPGTRRAP
jgi:iron complex transport system substrate-binding protein